MDEYEWIKSTSPRAMLAHVRYLPGSLGETTDIERIMPLMDERQARLIALALEPMLGGPFYADVDDWLEELEVYLQPEITLSVSNAVAADYFRDVVGNPFNPVLSYREIVACPDCESGKPDSYCDDCAGDGTVHVPCSWTVDPQVLQLAQAVYESADKISRVMDSSGLLALSDALEEAGCPSEEEITIPVNVRVYPHAPEGWAVYITSYALMTKIVFTHKRRIKAFQWAVENLSVIWADGSPSGVVKSNKGAHGTGFTQVKVPHRVLTHLRSSKPHIKGCWALDLLYRPLPK